MTSRHLTRPEARRFVADLNQADRAEEWRHQLASLLLVLLLLGLVAAALAGLLLLARPAAAAEVDPLDRATLGRLAEAWPDILEAGRVTDTDPLLIAAVVVGETGCRGVVGGAHGAMYGHGQIRWATWGALLREEGVADEAGDLLEPRAGVLAVGVVLEHLRVVYRRGGALTLCLYGSGVRALHWRRDCSYSKRALRIRAGLARRLGPGAAGGER